jgi:hypothetical protein
MWSYEDHNNCKHVLPLIQHRMCDGYTTNISSQIAVSGKLEVYSVIKESHTKEEYLDMKNGTTTCLFHTI